MSDSSSTSSEPRGLVLASGERLVVERRRFGLGFWIVATLLVFSLAANWVLASLFRSEEGQLLRASLGTPTEQLVEGDGDAERKIVVLDMKGTISPPFTKNWLRAIKRAAEDDAVAAVILAIDSPGGLVADSHQIYTELKKLNKPVWVCFQRIAASGGYYVAMGAGPDGRIYAEPTTWTGSIGVIIPRFELVGLAEKLGIESRPLQTGPLKDSLNPFKPLSDRQKEVWGEILDDAFGRFVGVISENRPPLGDAGVRELATGQIYTANQAIENGLVDRIGYLDEAIDDLRTEFDLAEASVVRYRAAPDLWELVSLLSSERDPQARWAKLVEQSTPQAMYLFAGDDPVRLAFAAGKLLLSEQGE